MFGKGLISKGVWEYGLHLSILWKGKSIICQICLGVQYGIVRYAFSCTQLEVKFLAYICTQFLVIKGRLVSGGILFSVTHCLHHNHFVQPE